VHRPGGTMAPFEPLMELAQAAGVDRDDVVKVRRFDLVQLGIENGTRIGWPAGPLRRCRRLRSSAPRSAVRQRRRQQPSEEPR